MVKYFKSKESKRVHVYPVPKSCNVEYRGETLYNFPPAGDKCDRCFGLPR